MGNQQVKDWSAVRLKNPANDALFHHSPEMIIAWLGEGIHEREDLSIADFGCGQGLQALSLSLRLPKINFLGIDLHRAFDFASIFAREELGLDSIPENLSFAKINPGDSLTTKGLFDYIISWSVFEHIERDMLPLICSNLITSLKPGGHILVQIEPLFYSPFGSHLRRFVPEPWAHLIYSHKVLRDKVMKAEIGELQDFSARKALGERRNNPLTVESYLRNRFVAYEELNRITADELVGVLQGVGFKIVRQSRNQVNMAVPTGLKSIYNEDLLRTNAVFVLGRRNDRSIA